MKAARGAKTRAWTCALTSIIGGAASASACGARSELAEIDGTVTELDASTYPDVAFDAPADAPRDVLVPDSAPTCRPLGPGDDGSACNQLAATGAPVSVTCAPPDAVTPTPTGGLITDGTYVLVASRFYGGECAGLDHERITWTLCGSAWSTVQEGDLGGSTTTQNIDGDVALGGADFVFTPTCPRSGVPVTRFGYDATGTTLTIYVYGYGPGRVRVDEFQAR